MKLEDQKAEHQIATRMLKQMNKELKAQLAKEQKQRSVSPVPRMRCKSPVPSAWPALLHHRHVRSVFLLFAVGDEVCRRWRRLVLAQKWRGSTNTWLNHTDDVTTDNAIHSARRP